MDTAVYIWQLDAPDDVWSMRLIEANPSAVAFAETSIDELLGQRLGDARPRFADPTVPERYIEALSTGQAVDLGVLRVLRPESPCESVSRSGVPDRLGPGRGAL